MFLKNNNSGLRFLLSLLFAFPFSFFFYVLVSVSIALSWSWTYFYFLNVTISLFLFCLFVQHDARLLGASGNPDARECAVAARDGGPVGGDKGESGADRHAQGARMPMTFK